MLKKFDTEAEAWDWLEDEAIELDSGDNYTDNQRLAYKDDQESVLKYNRQAKEGCCGFIDATVTINGREALLGCNYGH